MSETAVPAIPHVAANMTPLSVVLQRYSIHSFKKLKEYLKTLENSTQPDSVKKRTFLELLVSIRENFVRLYVLSKWARNSKNVEKLIDLFVWLREQNQTVSNALIQIGATKQSLVSAKLPNPDLETALEVLIKGQPQLPTHNYEPPRNVDPNVILRTLKDLNVELSTKMALEENLPKPFFNCEIKDGRVKFRIPNLFQCCVSIANTYDQSGFFLVDFKLEFQLKDNKLIPQVTALPRPTFMHLEKVANLELSKNGLAGLYNLFHNYAITCKLYYLHRQLIKLRMGLWKSHLTHTYNAEKCFVVVTYWLRRRSVRSTIEIGKMKNNELGFRWIREGQLSTDHGLKLEQEDGSINIEHLIRNIIDKHVQSHIKEVQNEIADKIDIADKFVSVQKESQLILKLSSMKIAVYGIDSLSGDGYFQNPTPIMMRIAAQINTDTRETALRLLSLRLEVHLSEISSLLTATTWLGVDVVKLPIREYTKLGVDYEHLKDQNLAEKLFALKFYRRREWPSGWFLTVGVSGFSSKVQWWCSRVKSSSGQWAISWIEPITLNSTEGEYSYETFVNLTKKTTSMLLCNMVVKELEDQGCKLKIVDKDDSKVKQLISQDSATKSNETQSEDSTTVVIDNRSLFNIPNCRDSLILVMNIKNSALEILIFGKLQNELKLSSISFNDEKNNSIELNPETSIFKIHSNVNLSEMLNAGSGANYFNSLSAPTEFSIMNDSLSVLNKFSSLLSLLHIVSHDESLKVIEISLSAVTFQYGSNEEEMITLVLLNESQDSISIELPKDNPHRLCYKYLNDMVAEFDFGKIQRLVKYLKLTLPFYKMLVKLSDENEELYQKFVDQNVNSPDLNMTPDNGYELNTYNFEQFKITYYKYVERKMEKKTKTEKVRVNLNVQLRHKTNELSLTKSLFLVTLEPLDTDQIDESMKQWLHNLVTSLHPTFNGDAPISSVGQVVYLKRAIACSYLAVEDVVDALHQKIRTLCKAN
ncbi:hypothetical protein OGAPHI_007255 [Ogataea philodendri]|uniref:Mediator of RNA polymerase II transcription subunit 14 n=1 Tax=Ogataea philodendri TaxID=1378263 RepID=A0A9P8SZN6_9ASCO|nr:uncharacterized protein OGAPHI_007255 [Ogataea philodendri]KAH3660050.1 hypothetical protein OGAPHI_007255 [Ogataea philodendri]